MNVEIGTEAAQFPEKEYINGIFVAVCVKRKKICYKFNLQKESQQKISFTNNYLFRGNDTIPAVCGGRSEFRMRGPLQSEEF
jgi:hypothetical protein